MNWIETNSSHKHGLIGGALFGLHFFSRYHSQIWLLACWSHVFSQQAALIILTYPGALESPFATLKLQSLRTTMLMTLYKSIRIPTLLAFACTELLLRRDICRARWMSQLSGLLYTFLHLIGFHLLTMWKERSMAIISGWMNSWTLVSIISGNEGWIY